MLGPEDDLWLRSNVKDIHREVTVSEVRPDGKETYVQSGWLRASRRTLDRDRSTALQPVPTFLEADVTPLPAKRAALVRVPVSPFGHAFREGSHVRITVQPPGGNRPSWAFDALTYEKRVINQVALGGRQASKVVLPVLPGVEVPTPLPAWRCAANPVVPRSPDHERTARSVLARVRPRRPLRRALRRARPAQRDG
jgi:predicted acyl esterase